MGHNFITIQLFSSATIGEERMRDSRRVAVLKWSSLRTTTTIDCAARLPADPIHVAELSQDGMVLNEVLYSNRPFREAS